MLRKRILEIETARDNKLQKIKNGKIIFEGRRNGLFMKAHSVSLAIMTKQIYDHINEQINTETVKVPEKGA